jgi:hypothetical protein
MIKWPLDINPGMDAHAASYNLTHWNCTDPKGNSTWVRKDGLICIPKFKQTGGYPVELMQLDRDYPMASPIFGVTRKCLRPPITWNCTREAGHSGPCAAYEPNKWFWICSATVACAAIIGYFTTIMVR